MATFNFTGAALYEGEAFRQSGTITVSEFSRLGSGVTSTGTASDNNASDNTFTVGETVTFQLSSPNVTFNGRFLGTTSLSGLAQGSFPPGSTGRALVIQNTDVAAENPTQQFIIVPIDPIPTNFRWLDPSGVSILRQQSFLVCFLTGTLIATPRGEVPVEDLSPGDLVLTADGRALPVLRMGRQDVVTPFLGSDAELPIEIAPGALADGIPSRPLRVTPAHGLLIDGVLVNAGALVNGTTIRRMTARELSQAFSVYHIETAEHVALLADGTPAESFVANVPDGLMTWQGEAPAIPAEEMAAPRAASRRQVPRRVLDAIAARAPSLAA